MKKFLFIAVFLFSLHTILCEEFKFTKVDPNDQIDDAPLYHRYNTWRLTTEQESVKSAIWNDPSGGTKSANLNLLNNFCIEFKLQFSNHHNTDDWVGADGIAFVLRNPTIQNNEIGGWGRGIGYQYVDAVPPQLGITHSLAVEFDTYYNDGEEYDQEIDNKENVDHIAYYYTNTIATRLGSDVNINPADDDVENAWFYTIKIVWVTDGNGGGTLSTYYGNETQARRAVFLTSTQVTDIGGSDVKWGFTSATRYSINEHTLIMSDLHRNECCNVDIEILQVGGEPMCDKYPKYCDPDFIPENFGGPLKVCAGSSVILKANDLDPGVRYVEWKKIINFGTPTEATVPITTQSPPSDYLLTFIPEETATYVCIVHYLSDCVAEDMLTIIPRSFTVTLPEESVFCQQETAILAPTVAVDGITNYTLNADAWIEWQWTETVVNPPTVGSLVSGSMTTRDLNLNLVGKYFTDATYTLTATYHEYFNNAHPSDFVMECEVSNVTTIVSEKFIAKIKILKAMCKAGCPGQLQCNVTDPTGLPIATTPLYTWTGPNGLSSDFGTPGPTAQNPVINSEGLYTVTVVLPGGCVAYADTVISFKDFKILEVKGKDLCSGGTSQEWKVFHTDCNPDYIYRWIGPAPSTTFIQTIDNVCSFSTPGDYTVEIENSEDCIISKNFNIKQKDFDCELIARELCVGENNDAKIEVKVIGGKPPFQYDWTKFDGTTYVAYTPTVFPPYIVQLPVGSYSLTITDGDSCTLTRQINVIVPNFFAHDYYGVCEGESVQLKTYKGIDPNEELHLNPGEHIVWTPSDGLNNSIDEMEPIATPDRDITYTGQFTYVNDNAGILTVGCKEVTCFVKVVKSDYDFVKSITENNSNFKIEINGLSATERVIYKQEDLDCGFLIFNESEYNDSPNCNHYNGATISKFSNDCPNTPVWEKYYGITENHPVLINDLRLTNISEVINIVDNDSVLFHNKVFPEHYLLAIGGYNESTSDMSQRNQNLLLMKLNPTNGTILHNLSGNNKLLMISIDGKSEIAIKAIQSKDNQFIYVLGWVSSTKNGLRNAEDCNDFLLFKLYTSTLQPVWEKMYSTENNDIPYDLIETDNNEIIVVGESNNKTFLLKVNSDGTTAATKKYQSLGQNYYNTSNSIFKDGSNYIICGTNKYANTGTVNNIQIFKVTRDLNIIANSSFAIGIDDDIEPEIKEKNVILKSAVFNKNNNLNLVIHHKPININNESYSLHYLEVDPDIHIINQAIYYQSPIDEEICKYPITQSLPLLQKQNFQGIASLASVKCFGDYPVPNYDDKSDKAVLVKFNTYNNIMKNEQTTCLLNDNIFQINENSISSDNYIFNVLNIGTNNTYWLPKFIDQSISLLRTNATCGNLNVCHCDDSRINVIITPIEDIENGKCNYTISFTTPSDFVNNCNIVSVAIVDQSFNQNFGTMLPNTPYGLYNLSIDEFSGIITLTFNYKDAVGNIVCSTTKDIVCGCTCEDFEQNLKFDFEMTSESPTQCCYDLFLNNEKNSCSFREPGITIEYPLSISSNQITFTPESNWSLNATQPANSIKLDRGVNQIIGGALPVKIGTICVERNNEIKSVTIKINKDNNDTCSKIWKQDLGCLKSCCEYINNVTLTPTNSNSEFCCYTLSYEITGDISECSQDTKLQVKYNGKVLFEITPQSIIEGNYSITVCIEKSLLEGLPKELDLSLDFVSVVGDEEIIVCSKELEAVINCLTCCDDIQVLMSSEATYDDGNNCCFDYNVLLSTNPICSGFTKIVIEDLHGNKLMENSLPGYLALGVPGNQFSLCISKEDFLGETSMKIKIKFLNSGGREICNKEFELEACNDLPDPCVPDYPEVGWIGPVTGYLPFNCSEDPSAPQCMITYQYKYRHVKNGSTSVHRDVQVLSYSYNSECTCVNSIISSIFWDIMNTQAVRTAFNIDEQVPPMGQACFNNYRLITSDCWQITADFSHELHFTRKCDGIVCCYAIYTVCYANAPSLGGVCLMSYTKYSGVYIPSLCEPIGSNLCYPDKCTSFGPIDDSDVRTNDGSFDDILYAYLGGCPPPHMTTKINAYTSYLYGSTETDVFIVQNELNNNLDISIVNNVKGDVSIEIFGLLGNSISTYNYTKTSDNFNQSIKTDLLSGMYVCTVKLNNKVIGSKKIIIVK